jgi:hypothetical protein
MLGNCCERATIVAPRQRNCIHSQRLYDSHPAMNVNSRSRGRGCPSFTKRCPLAKTEGAGKTGCALHPRSRVQLCEKLRTRAYRFSGEHPAFPAQWLYGLCRDLLGDEFCLVTVAAGFRRKRSGWIASATDSLTPATGAGTTRFCRTHQRRSSARRLLAHGKPALQDHCAPTLPRPPHPTARFVTIASRPSCRVRRAEL